jgi:hypothetical protein
MLDQMLFPTQLTPIVCGKPSRLGTPAIHGLTALAPVDGRVWSSSWNANRKENRGYLEDTYFAATLCEIPHDLTWK